MNILFIYDAFEYLEDEIDRIKRQNKGSTSTTTTTPAAPVSEPERYFFFNEMNLSKVKCSYLILLAMKIRMHSQPLNTDLEKYFIKKAFYFIDADNLFLAIYGLRFYYYFFDQDQLLNVLLL